MSEHVDVYPDPYVRDDGAAEQFDALDTEPYLLSGPLGLAGDATDDAISGAIDTTGSLTRASLDALYVQKLLLGYEFPTVLGDFTALQDAADRAAANGKVLWSTGTMNTSSTLVLKCGFDLSSMSTWTYTGTTGTAFTVGDSTISNQWLRGKFPRQVIASAKGSSLGWAMVAGTVGIDFVNCLGCDFDMPRRVASFETGMQTRGATGSGCQQTTFRMGHLDNNKVNVRFKGDPTGWSNQNTFLGGRCSHNSGEGSQVAGTRHLLFEANSANPCNGHVFVGTSLESPDVVEFHAEFANTLYVLLVDPRWENTGGTSHTRTKSTGASKFNMVIGGAYSENIDQSQNDGTAQPVDVITPGRSALHGGSNNVPTLTLENIFSNSMPVLTTMASGAGAAKTDPTTGYCTKLTSNLWSGKRSTDTYDRLQIDFQNGRVYLGDAVGANPVGYLSGSASALLVGGGLPFSPLGASTQDLGLASLRWRDVYVGRYIRIGTLYLRDNAGVLEKSTDGTTWSAV